MAQPDVRLRAVHALDAEPPSVWASSALCTANAVGRPTSPMFPGRNQCSATRVVPAIEPSRSRARGRDTAVKSTSRIIGGATSAPPAVLVLPVDRRVAVADDCNQKCSSFLLKGLLAPSLLIGVFTLHAARGRLRVARQDGMNRCHD